MNQCLISSVEPHLFVKVSGPLFGYNCDELQGQSILILCGPWTDSLLLFCAISEACVMKPKIVKLFLRDKAGTKRLCKVSCSPADTDCRSGLAAACEILFVSEDEGSTYIGNSTLLLGESYRSTVSSQSYEFTLDNIKSAAYTKEMLQYQGALNILVQNQVFDNSLTISIPQLLDGYSTGS